VKSRKLASTLLTVVGLGLATASTPASALVQFFFPRTNFEDNNIDRIFDNDNSGTVSVGDRFVSIQEFGATSGDLSGQGPTPIGPEEFTSIVDITAVGLVGNNVIFAPTGAGGLLAGFAAGTAAAVWLDATPDLNVINGACGTVAQCAALAGLGGGDGSTLYLTLGFFGDLDATIIGSPIGGAAISIPVLAGGGPNTSFGVVNISLQVGVNNTGFALGEQACAPFCGPGGNGLIQVTGSGNLLGGSGLNQANWTARSDNDVGVVPIPEPASIALLGLAFVGLGLMRRRSTTS